VGIGPGRDVLDLGAGTGKFTRLLVPFGARLQASLPAAWRAGNDRLYDYYRQAAPHWPDSIDTMLPLFAAVVHGCRAGRAREALATIYRDRIQRGPESFNTKVLGAVSAELNAVASFFERAWDRPLGELTSQERTYVLNEAAYDLHALGRLLEAVQPSRASIDGAVKNEEWASAAISAGNLCELVLSLGDVDEGLAIAAQAAGFAERSTDDIQRLLRGTDHGHALHQAGRWEESLVAFRESEKLQVELTPSDPWLYSLQGYQYCDLLLALAEPANGSLLEQVGEAYRVACLEVVERAEHSIASFRPGAVELLMIALDHLSLARAHLGLQLTTSPDSGDFDRAEDHIDECIGGLRQAGRQDYLASAFIARATVRRIRRGFKAATDSLAEALELSERCSMRLRQADTHLEWTRLSLDTGDPAPAQAHLDRARQLVQACGYGKRQREVAWLAGRVGISGHGPAAQVSE